MKALDHTPIGADVPEPTTDGGSRLLDLADQMIRLPSDKFTGGQTITRTEWLRRHAETYGPVAS